MTKTDREALVETLISFELAVADLYAVFAVIFPADKDRWTSFVNEERLHARWLAKLKFYLKNEIISLQETKITVQAVKNAVEFIKGQADRATRYELSLKEAVLIALDIENSALESSFFKIFAFNTPNAEKVRRDLAAATRTHRERFILWLDRIERDERTASPELLVA